MSTTHPVWSTQAPTLVPGAYDTITARLVAEAGYDAVYVSGAGVSYSRVGRPDIGLVGITEMADVVGRIASVVDIPVIADGDNGYGNALNTMRTVELFERAGASAIQLEDQAFPKRCGHLGGKRLVSQAEMVGKIQAACAARTQPQFKIIGRTDSRSVLGLSKAIDRAAAYREAGADVIFVEAPQSLEELDTIAKALPGVPMVVNMVEGGRTPILPIETFAELGYALVLYPNALTRAFVHRGRNVLRHIKAHGTSQGLDQMVDFGQLNEFLQLDQLAQVERKYVRDEE